MRIGIRLKLAFFSLFLLAVPLLGYQFIMELDNYLRQGQEQTLIGTARAVATALHERPGLFNKQSSYLTDVKPGMDLYAHSIIDPIQLDGRLPDWQEYRELNLDLFYNGKYLLDKNQQGDYQESDLSFSHMVGIYNDYLYAFFEVTDDSVVMRPSDSLRVISTLLLPTVQVNTNATLLRIANRVGLTLLNSPITWLLTALPARKRKYKAIGG